MSDPLPPDLEPPSFEPPRAAGSTPWARARDPRRRGTGASRR